jgi:hypothetical protein
MKVSKLTEVPRRRVVAPLAHVDMPKLVGVADAIEKASLRGGMVIPPVSIHTSSRQM